MQTKLIFSPEDSHANPTQPQESGSVKMMNAICGPKCLEQFARFNHVGLWAKTYAALLIGTGEWYSTRCKLTWRLVGTKSSRLYFLLVPKTLPTEGIEFGLWPTVTSVQRDHPERVEKLKATGATTMMSRKAGENRPNSVLDMAMFVGLLPTPTAMMDEAPIEKVDARNIKQMEKGNSPFILGLGQQAMRGLLPTPRTSDERMHWKTENCKGDDLGSYVNEAIGTRSHLNPQFVEEMMGFPENWTLLPFQNGETNQSKPMETQ
jgi:hypothetical protein